MKLKKEQFLGTNFSFTSHEFNYFVEAMKELDVHNIEFYAASPHLYLYDVTPMRAYELQRKLKYANIAVEVFTAEQCMYPISISINDELVRQRSLDYYVRALDCASVLGSPNMQIVTGPGYLSDNHEDDFNRATEGLYQIVKYAEKLGITIYLENDPNTSVRDSVDTKKMIDIIGSKNLKGLIDTNGIATSGEDFKFAVENLEDDLKHLHFIDYIKEPEQYCLIPGTGELPLEEYLNILAERNYKGTLTPELWGSNYLNDPKDAMRRSLQYCWDHAE